MNMSMVESKESRIKRAQRIITLSELKESGRWVPCDHRGLDQDQESAEYVKCNETGKVYKWNQQKRIEDHERDILREKEITKNINVFEGLEDVHVSHLTESIDRVYSALEEFKDTVHQFSKLSKERDNKEDKTRTG